jgi:hypothetical protein
MSEMQPAAPQPLPPTAASMVVLQQVGRISVTADWVVTPGGSWRLADTNITSHDQTATTTHTPGWAIVLVIVFIWFFLLSLLFLLAKETRVRGYILVIVQSGEQSYTDQVPVYSAISRDSAINKLAHIQSLIGWARNNRATGVA